MAVWDNLVNNCGCDSIASQSVPVVGLGDTIFFYYTQRIQFFQFTAWKSL